MCASAAIPVSCPSEPCSTQLLRAAWCTLMPCQGNMLLPVLITSSSIARSSCLTYACYKIASHLPLFDVCCHVSGSAPQRMGMCKRRRKEMLLCSACEYFGPR
jgi:hypothetical protein